MRLRVLAIVGPTASGKTALGVDVAHALGSEIVSADSRQVYRGLDIGSGKDLEEYSRVTPAVPYHLIDVADPRNVYSLFDYQRDCYALFASKAGQPALRDGTPLVMVGGTGLYVEAVLAGYRIADVPENPELRARLERRPHHELVSELERADADLAARTDRDNTRRVIRALEVAEFAKRGSVHYSSAPPVEIEATIFAIELATDELARRIDRRLEERFAAGMLDEVRDLLESGVPAARLERLGLEYRELTLFLRGDKTRDAMLHDLRYGIRHLAKRQRTWFRGLARRGFDVTWISPDDADRLLLHRWE